MVELSAEAIVQGYKIFLLDKAGRISLAYDFEGSDDLSALEESKKHNDQNGIEIWQRSRLVARIDQDGRTATG